MRINDLFRGILSPVTGAPSGASQAEPAAKADTRPSGPAANTAVASAPLPPASQKFRDILAEFDIRRISPRDFSTLLQKLHSAGQIADQDFKTLSELRTTLDRDGVDADRPMDLLDYLSQQEQSRQTAGDDLGLTPAGLPASAAPDARQTSQRQLEWLQKFALVHHGADAEAFDAVA